MAKLFDDNRKKKNKEAQIAIGSQIATNQSVQQMTAKADEKFYKPKYNPQTRRTHYDDGISHKEAKNAAFSSDGVVRDPYTDAELVLTTKEAKMKYGNNWQEHLAEADHIDPLNQIARRTENKPWVTAEDIKNVGNSQDNFQVISRRTNQTGGKGGSTQAEWSQDHERMQKISGQTGESVESISKRTREIGEEAEKRNNAKFTQAEIKNVATTACTAGKAAAINSGGTVATISGIYNIVSCIKGEKTASDALKDIGKESAKASVAGYVNGAALTVLNHTLTSSKSEFLKVLGKNNVAGKVIITVSVTGETVAKCVNGEISVKECVVELGDKGCSFGGASCGAVVGQTVIPIPIVGAAVGSLIGGTLTSELYDNIIRQKVLYADEEERRKQQEIYEAMMRYYAEQQRRAEVQQLIKTNTEMAALSSIQSIIQSGEFQNLMRVSGAYFRDRAEIERRIAECVLVTLQLNEYRRQLQECTDRYFAECRECFSSALDFMDSSLKIGNCDGAIAGVNQVTKLFAKDPVVENTEDFRKKIFGNGDISF